MAFASFSARSQFPKVSVWQTSSMRPNTQGCREVGSYNTQPILYGCVLSQIVDSSTRPAAQSKGAVCKKAMGYRSLHYTRTPKPLMAPMSFC